MMTQTPKHVAKEPVKTKNTVFVLVPGAWHPTDYLEPTQDYLREMGYNSIAVSHQTLDITNPGNSVFDDAAKLETTVKELLDAGKNVVVVMHSYGGSVGSQAIGHLLSTIKSSPSNNKAGQIGQVLHLVYVAAILALEGETSADLGAMVTATNPGNESLPIKFVDGKLLPTEEMKELFYHDLPESERNKYYNLLQPFPATGIPDALTHFGWMHVPSTYIYARNDRVLSYQAQEHMVNRANLSRLAQMGGSVSDEVTIQQASYAGTVDHDSSQKRGWFTVKMIDSDHCSMFILPRHVKSLGSMLIDIVEPAKQGMKHIGDVKGQVVV